MQHPALFPCNVSCHFSRRQTMRRLSNPFFKFLRAYAVKNIIYCTLVCFCSQDETLHSEVKSNHSPLHTSRWVASTCKSVSCGNIFHRSFSGTWSDGHGLRASRNGNSKNCSSTAIARMIEVGNGTHLKYPQII